MKKNENQKFEDIKEGDAPDQKFEDKELSVKSQLAKITKILTKLNELAKPVIERKTIYPGDNFYSEFEEKYNALNQDLNDDLKRITKEVQKKYPNSFLEKTWNWIKDVMERLRNAITGGEAKRDTAFQICEEINSMASRIMNLIEKAESNNKLHEAYSAFEEQIINKKKGANHYPVWLDSVEKALQRLYGPQKNHDNRLQDEKKNNLSQQKNGQDAPRDRFGSIDTSLPAEIIKPQKSHDNRLQDDDSPTFSGKVDSVQRKRDLGPRVQERFKKLQEGKFVSKITKLGWKQNKKSR